MEDIDSILKGHHLRITKCREDILSLFIREPYALSHGFFEEQFIDLYDRVTIYRTLKSFLAKGLIHKVLDDAGGLKYALCREVCMENHNHEHIHFKCEHCGKTICMDALDIPKIKLPDGFIIDEMCLLVSALRVETEI